MQAANDILPVHRTRGETKSYYDRLSSIYAPMTELSEGPVRRRGLKLLGAVSGEKILEVGFGPGQSLVSLAEAVGESGHIDGIDLSEKMLEVAARRLRKQGLSGRVKLSCGDATHLPYPVDTFDAIFMSFTLELFDTPEIPVVLAECRRVLRPQGRIVVVCLSREGKPGIFVRTYEWLHRHFPSLADCRPIYAAEEMEKAGFRILKRERVGKWIPFGVVEGEKT